MFYNSDDSETLLARRARIAAKAWNHVLPVRHVKKVPVYLNGQPAFQGDAEPAKRRRDWLLAEHIAAAEMKPRDVNEKLPARSN